MGFIIFLVIFFILVFFGLGIAIGWFGREVPMSIKVYDLRSRSGTVRVEHWGKSFTGGFWHEGTSVPGEVRVRMRYGPFGMWKKSMVIAEDEFMMLPGGSHGIYGLSRLYELKGDALVQARRASAKLLSQLNAARFGKRKAESVTKEELQRQLRQHVGLVSEIMPKGVKR